MVTQQPSGIVAFLFTDVEDSTVMWNQRGDDMATLLEAHDRIVRAAIDSSSGYIFTTAGDSFSAAFSSTLDALEAAIRIQSDLADASEADGIRVRVGIHSGEATLRDSDYFGPAVNRAARVMSLGHGGQILLSGVAASLVSDGVGTTATLVDLGEHDLAGFEQPEPIFQATVPGGRDEFPPLRSVPLVRTNLPEQPTPFIGREGELDDLVDLINRSRMVSIVASGGAGKSRLAVELGTRMIDQFSDGVFFVPLAARSNPDEVPEALAESLGIVNVAATDTMSQVVDYLAPKQQLVILDNFEHVKEGSEYVSRIIDTAPEVTVLATSRTRLGLRGESVYPLGGLQAGWDNAEDAMAASGTLLFLDSARRRDPMYEIGEEDLVSLARLLQLVDGLPLAIEIAASWVDVLPLAEIVQEVEANIDFLESEMSDAPDRHRSIRAVFDYSWSTLSERERAIFPKLSVFRGGFTRQAAQEIAGASLRDLSGLADKSLLLPSRATGRFTVHELLRQYAADRLAASGDTDVTLDAHAAFYGRFARSVFESIRKGNQIEALADAEADIDNLRTGYRRGAQFAPDVGREYLECLWFVHEVRSWLPAGRDLFRDAAASARGSDVEGSDHLAALSEAKQAWFVTLMGDAEEGLRLATAAHGQVMADDPSGADACLVQQCRNIALLFLDPEGIRAGSEEAERLAQRDGDEWWRMTLRVWDAYSYVFELDDTGERMALEGVEYFSAFGDHWVQVWPIGLLGNRAEQAGDLETAQRWFGKALTLGREIGFQRIVQYMLNALGRVTRARGDFGTAEHYFAESLAVSVDAGQKREILGGLADFAAIRVGQERWSEAAELLAVVALDPLKTQRTVFSEGTIVDYADELGGQVEAAVGAEEYHRLRSAPVSANSREAAEMVLAPMSYAAKA